MAKLALQFIVNSSHCTVSIPGWQGLTMAKVFRGGAHPRDINVHPLMIILTGRRVFFGCDVHLRPRSLESPLSKSHLSSSILL